MPYAYIPLRMPKKPGIPITKGKYAPDQSRTEAIFEVDLFLEESDYQPPTAYTYHAILFHISAWLEQYGKGKQSPLEMDVDDMVHLFKIGALCESKREDGSTWIVRPASCNPEKKDHDGKCSMTKGCGWSGSQRHNVLCAVRAWLRWTDAPEDHPMLSLSKKDHNRMRTTAKYRQRSDDVRWLRYDQYLLLIDTLETGEGKYGKSYKRYKLRNLAITKLLWSSLARAHELLQVNIEDISLVENRNGKAPIYYAKIHGKAKAGGEKREREIFWEQDAQDAIEKWLKERHGKYGMPEDSGPLFVNTREGRKDRRLTQDGLRLLLRRLGKLAGLDGCSAHDFRRGSGAWKYEQGWSLDILMVWGGWEDITTMMKYFAGAIKMKKVALFDIPI